MEKNFFFCLAIIAALIPAAAKAQSGVCGMYVTWQLADSTLTVSGEGEMYDNKSTNDFSYAIYSEQVNKVIINEGVTSVGSHAFSGFSNLRSVALPSSLTHIRDYSFSKTPLTEITTEEHSSDVNSGRHALYFPENLKVIGESAFEYCNGIEDLHFNASLDSISSCAFLCSENIKTVHLTARIVDECAFGGNYNISEINISDNVRTIDSFNFGLVNLKSLTFPATLFRCDYTLLSGGHVDNVYIECVDAYDTLGWDFSFTINKLEYAEGVKVCQYAAADTVIIPESVERINGGNAGLLIYKAIAAKNDYWGTFDCDKISIADGVQLIPEKFLGGNIQNVDFPLSVTEIGKYALYYCKNLQSVTAHWENPDEITAKAYAFGYRHNDATLYVPAGSEDKYAAHPKWSIFDKILPIDTGITDALARPGVYVATNGPVVKVSGLADYENVEIYDLNGRLAGRGVATGGTCSITIDTDQDILLVRTATATIKIKR